MGRRPAGRGAGAGAPDLPPLDRRDGRCVDGPAGGDVRRARRVDRPLHRPQARRGL